jgi:predicted ester cyclase
MIDMRHAIVPLAIVLALVSGVVLAETRRVVLVPAVVFDADALVPFNDGVVRRFYAAVNAVLATNDGAALDGILAADMVAHSARPGVTPDRAGLIRSLRILRAIAPGLRLTVLEILVQGDRAAARVGVEGGADAAFLGHPVAAERLWGAVDVFRVEAGRIVEYWSDLTEGSTLEPLLSVTLPVADAMRQVVTLARWTYPPGASETRTTDWGSLVISVDAGTLTVNLEGGEIDAVHALPWERTGPAGGERPVSEGVALTLERGDAVVVPMHTRFAARNDGGAPATALVVGLSTTAPEWRVTGPVTEAGGVISHKALAGGMTAVLPPGGVTIELGRAALAPGAVLPPRLVDVAELAAVEAGEAAVTADGGAVWVTYGRGGGERLDASGTVAAGDGAHFDPGSAAGYRATGTDSLALLLVSIAAEPTDLAIPAP